MAGSFDPLVYGEDQVNGTFPLSQEPITFKILIPLAAESFAKFVTGQGNIDEERDAYLSQLDAMGLDHTLRPTKRPTKRKPARVPDDA